MSSQKQAVGQDGEAYQAGRDLTVNQALSPDQMGEIIVKIAGHLQQYVAEAESKFNNRIEELKESLIKEFTDVNSGANSEAFKDPDFQFALRNAQERYGRIGGEDLREELVKLLNERSKVQTSTRAANLLNDAISLSGQLSKEEIAVLVVVFVIRRVGVNGLDFPETIQSLWRFIVPFVEDLPVESEAVEYLQSLRCVTLERLTAADLTQQIHQNNSQIFTRGLLPQEILSFCADEAEFANIMQFMEPYRKLLIGRLRLKIGDPNQAREALSSAGISESTLNKILGLVNERSVGDQQLKSEVLDSLSGFPKVDKLWRPSGMAAVMLTPLGSVVAHSALSGMTDFDAPLNIWVK